MSLLSSSIILLFISASLCYCDCDIKWPNGTDKALHWWQCGPSPITVYNISILDMNGNPEYPIYLTAPIQAWADIDDPNIIVTNPNLKANVNIWSWNDKDCSWASVPTFGLLKNLNGCDYTKCPINPGRQWISGVIDFSEFQANYLI
ncbi:hypothetical protein WR25_09587 [Diploscapter pachys]|uniref:MD-2-related lipid-recognition domain-containing protein n=1 Tax=Diploscapter pachys TaxID=2018661 RepID=A0A2A2KX70_9BILA|nr:hypothetical protein WR25_09587 [Diploscapter pachys]